MLCVSILRWCVRAFGHATFRNKTPQMYFFFNVTLLLIFSALVVLFALSSYRILFYGHVLAFKLEIALNGALHPMWKECMAAVSAYVAHWHLLKWSSDDRMAKSLNSQGFFFKCFNCMHLWNNKKFMKYDFCEKVAWSQVFEATGSG